ncbi:PQQ-binding-like beta-propeller repeat protein [Allorhizocola rhizosphaerae]|uniref:outer membrane protein assembly factor BamB family protein n=1 Tax=Allorhizocola rhizosphaerae TaxID=1872709 RepID=UPI0013C37B32|nr:PQQ-binding-like beta-propeller repeat protein [Allorhizocola rhizosphaerae]
MREIVIDLGEEWAPPASAPRPGRRSKPAFLVLLLLPLVLAGSPGVPPAPSVTELGLLAVPDTGGERVVFDDIIVVATHFGWVSAFELNGRPRWRAQIDATTDVLSIQRAGGLVHVTADSAGQTTTIGFDPATGRQEWSAPGQLSVVDDAAVLVNRPHSVNVFDAATLRERWSAGAIAAQPFPDSGSILVLTGDGEISERKLSTGAVIATARVTLPDKPRLLVGRDRIVIRGRLDSVWLDRATLRPASPTVNWSQWRDCGPVICARIEDGERTLIVDPRGGQVLRALPEGNAAVATPAGLMVLADGSDGSPAVETLDPISGRRRIPLSGWYTVSGNASGSVPPLLVWPTHGRSYLAQLRPDGLLIIASVPHELSECLYERHLLLCSTSQGRLGLWRVRSGNGA